MSAHILLLLHLRPVPQLVTQHIERCKLILNVHQQNHLVLTDILVEAGLQLSASLLTFLRPPKMKAIMDDYASDMKPCNAQMQKAGTYPRASGR